MKVPLASGPAPAAVITIVPDESVPVADEQLAVAPKLVIAEISAQDMALPCVARRRLINVSLSVAPMPPNVFLVSVSVVARPTNVSAEVGKESVAPLFRAVSFRVPLASAAVPLPTAIVAAAVRERPVSGGFPKGSTAGDHVSGNELDILCVLSHSNL